MKYNYYQENKPYNGKKEPVTFRQRKHARLHGPNWEIYYRHENSQIIGFTIVAIMLGMLVFWMLSCEPR